MPPIADNTRQQITALEFAYSKAVTENKPAKYLFSLQAKIKKMKRILEDQVRFDWLAR